MFYTLLVIANPSLGDTWLGEMKRHCHNNNTLQMQLEKLRKLVLVEVGDDHKIHKQQTILNKKLKERY